MSQGKPTKKALEQQAKSLGLKGYTTLKYQVLYNLIEAEKSRLENARGTLARRRAFHEEVQERGYQELMDIINRLRREYFDASPVNHLSKGTPALVNKCPVAMAITQGVEAAAVDVVVLPSLIRLTNEAGEWIVDSLVEGFAYYFIRGLEAGKYPEFSV